MFPSLCPNFPVLTMTGINIYGFSTNKLGLCIDIVEIGFGIANGQILSIFDRVICPPCDSFGVL